MASALAYRKLKDKPKHLPLFILGRQQQQGNCYRAILT